KLGAVFLIVSMVSLMLAITLMKEISLYFSQILLLLGVFLCFLVFFIWWEKKQKYPLVSIELFRNIPFSATITTSFIQSMAMFGGLLLIPMYLQKVHDFSPTYSGILILPMSLAMMVMAPLMGNVSTEKKRQNYAFKGMIVLVVGLGIFSTLKFESRYLILAAALVTTGIGLGISGTPLSTSVINLVSREQTGVASGIFNMMRFLGGVVGSTIFGVYLQNRISYHSVGSDLSLPGMQQIVMTESFHDVYILAMIFASFGVITALGMRVKEKETETVKGGNK
ncbi:MAG: drug resistance transporter, EmrB/QacA subfamily, partial [Anaerospora sp.]|nr:drug resistance transporter, EmrB/QacA subfamily [Anaerospora sp.]